MFGIFKKITWFIKENKKLFIIFILSNIIAGCITIFMPKIVGYLINLISLNILSFNTFLIVIFLLILLCIIGYICGVTFIYLLFKLSLLFEVNFRDIYYKHVMKMTGTFFSKYAIGDLMTRITSDLRQVSIAIGEGTFFILEGTIFFILVIIGMLTSSNITLTMFTILPLIVLILILMSLGDKILISNNVAQNTLSRLSESILETVDGIAVIKAYVKENYMLDKLINQIEYGKKKFKVVDNLESFITFLVWMFFGISEMIALVLGTNMVVDGKLSIGELVTFILYLGILTWPVIAWAQVIGILKRGESSYDRLQEIIDDEEDVKLLASHKFIDDFQSIEFVNFSFKYPNSDEYALKNISFSFNKGETIGLVGTIGGGRSTILKQLLMDYPILKNESLLLNGESYNNYNIDSIRSLFGYVPQDNIIFSKSIKENLMVAKKNATEYEVMHALKVADFERELYKFSKGIDTPCGEEGNLLSGGQRQRLAIARAFLNNPEILILDDALAAVDGESEKRIMNNILKNRIDKTNIIITNRVGVLRNASKILIIDNGRIISQGTHNYLLENSLWYRNEYKYQNKI